MNRYVHVENPAMFSGKQQDFCFAHSWIVKVNTLFYSDIKSVALSNVDLEVKIKILWGNLKMVIDYKR